MPRKPKQVQVNEGAVIDQEKISGAMVEMRQIAENTNALAATLNYSGSLKPEALEEGIRSNQQRIGAEVFEMGTRLLLLREQCSHGELTDCLDRLGISARAAQKFMQATLKFSNAPSTAHLENIGKTKLLELVVLDDGEIEELTNGGSARGITLDDVDRMSVTELRAALRESKAEHDATTALLRDRSARLDEANTKQRLVKVPSADDTLAELRREVTALHLDAEGAIVGSLRQGFVTLADYQLDGADSTLFMAGLVAQLRANLDALVEEFGLPTVDSNGDHDWINNEGQEA